MSLLTFEFAVYHDLVRSCLSFTSDPVTYEWPKNVVHTLINELGKRIGDFKFQKKRIIIPKDVYESISKAMRQKGLHYPAKILHGKKRGLDSSFCRNKKAGNINWPFMQGMIHLHSGTWPVGFVSGDALGKGLIPFSLECFCLSLKRTFYIVFTLSRFIKGRN